MERTAVRQRAQRVRCLEIWGGNLRIEKHVRVPGLDAWLSSHPLGDDNAGGDVYYISSCAAGRLTRILLADVSGHGQRVAHLAGHLRDLMRANIEVADHRRFVVDMNRQFEAESRSDAFATAVVLSYYAPTRLLTLCNAGHPAPLVYRQAQGLWEFLEASDDAQPPTDDPAGLPLGISPHTTYDETRIRLDRGDMVLCYTDAFIEACQADGSLLGTQGLLKLVSGLPASGDGAELTNRVIEALRQLNPENLEHDDATLIVFRATGVRFHVTDQVMAPWRHFFSRPADASQIGEPHRWSQSRLEPSGDQSPETIADPS